MPNTLEQRVEDLLRQLTLQEKIALLSGRDAWNTVPVARLGIPSITMTDGPHGVRSANPEAGRVIGPATCFPTGISMAASWDPELVARVGRALGEETRAMGCDILLGPCVNIIRSPLGGRNFESYSEDPYLAGRTAVAFIKGVQSRGIGTSVKHFAANNYEIERNRASSNVDERTLREIYLPAFEAAVKEAEPWTVMCSYNRINGVYASQNHHLLTEILKDEWGFAGLVMSDWGANHEVYESVQGGLDLEMPGPAKYFGSLLSQAVANWQIDRSVIDAAVRRILSVILRSGKLEGTRTRKGSVNTPAHQGLARELAEQAITLLKNDNGVLPFKVKKMKSLAVIGPNAATAVIEGGGSSHVEPPYRLSPLEALKSKLDKRVKLEYEQGCDNYDSPPLLNPGWLSQPEGGARGLKMEVFNTADFSGSPARLSVASIPEHWMHVNLAQHPEPQISLRWSARLNVPASGLYSFALSNTGICRVLVEGKMLIQNRVPVEERDGSMKTAEMKLYAGISYDLRVELARQSGQEIMQYSLGLAAIHRPGKDERLKHAVNLAQHSDAVILFAGLPEGFESEGRDRPHMHLPGGQDELIQAVAHANPKTVVVLNAGSPVSMPWLDEVAALLMAYYPGQENGNAVVNVLLGKVNPSGKLPATFPRRLEDNPAFINSAHPGARNVNYGEGIFVGYRYYDAKDIEPLFPFGFGLSYTSFEYSQIQVPARIQAGESFKVSVDVKNTGKVPGKEAVQLYIRDKTCSLPRPPKELKGFVKVNLQPGELKTVSIVLDERALSYFDPHLGRWLAEPGEFEVLVGGSSRDIRLRAPLLLT